MRDAVLSPESEIRCALFSSRIFGWVAVQYTHRYQTGPKFKDRLYDFNMQVVFYFGTELYHLRNEST